MKDVTKLEVEINPDHLSLFGNYIDKTILQMLSDSKHWNEPLISKGTPIFDPSKPIEKLDVKDSVMIRLICSRKPQEFAR